MGFGFSITPSMQFLEQWIFVAWAGPKNTMMNGASQSQDQQAVVGLGGMDLVP